MELSVASDTDLAHARALTLGILEGLPFVLPAPQASVWIESVGDSAIILGMAAWINQNDTNVVLARSEAIRLVQAAFDHEGIGAPFPIYRLLHEGRTPAAGARQAVTSPPYQGFSEAPAPAQDVDAVEDQQLAQIVEQERSEKHDDLLHRNADQE